MTLGALAFAWLLGLAAAAYTGAETWAALAAIALLAVVSFALRPRPTTLAFVAVATALVLTATWRYEATSPPDAPTGISRLNDADAVRFRAVVAEEPDERGASTRYRLTVRERFAEGHWRPESGGVLMLAPPLPRFEYGDLIEAEGELEGPPTLEDFDYREYLLRRGIGSIVAYPRVRLVEGGHGNDFRAAVISVRERLSDALDDVLPEPEASLAGGVLLGKRSRLPADLTADMNATGTSHLVAVSGQNVTLVAALLIAVLAWAIGRRQAAWLALVAVAAYALLVGGEPSVLRAAIMGGLYVVAIAVGRQSAGPIALALAGAVMAALDPQVVHDVSFQLSFAATLGLMTLAPLLAERLRGLAARSPALDGFALARPAAELAAVTLAAIAFTLPITAVNFERVSLAAPLANLLAVPAFLAVAVTAAVTAAIGALIPESSSALSVIAWPPAAYIVAVVRLAAGLPLASVEVRGLSSGHAIAYYALLAGSVWLLARRRGEPVVAPPAPSAERRRLPVGGMATLLLLASALLWLAITAPTSGRLTVTFLDVGQGDAILIEGPEGHRVLVDGGPSEEAIVNALGRRLPFYDRRIDLVVLTHPQLDHFGGLPAVLERYDVRAVLASPLKGEGAAYRAWAEAARRSGVPYHEAVAGQAVELGDGAGLHVLSAPDHAGDPNEASVVIKLRMGLASFLLTGDTGPAAEAALVHSGADLRATVYKVPHHGSASSASDEMLADVGPLVDVISVGKDNPFGHPAAEVLERLDGDAVFRTDRQGDVSVSTDGRRLWVRTDR